MPVAFEINDDMLIMTLDGTWSLEAALSAKAESTQLQRKHGTHAILVDIRKAHLAFSTGELFDFCVSFQDAFLPGTWHAVLYSKKTNAVSDLQFAENVARNRGVFMKMFLDFDEAYSWLHKHTSPICE